MKLTKEYILNMPKGIYTRTAKAKNAGRPLKESKMVMTSLRLPIEVKQGLTTQEKRVVLITAHEQKMNDLTQWCDIMLNKLK
jgi:hypothetical protein